MKLRAGLLAATVIAATVCMGAAPLGSTASAAAPRFAGLSDPSVSFAPSFSFTAGCTGMDGSRSDLDGCISVAIPDFNAARQGEGLTPLVLPNDFDILSAPEQLLALTNIERVDRDLAAVPALSSRLDALAQAGAAAGQDPAFPTPFDGTAAGSNWFSGTSTLLAMFEWMYDDGPSSGNSDCAAAGQPGCWAHRHTILGTGGVGGSTLGYDSPIAMGAAVNNGSVTAELVGGDTTDQADVTPTWAQIVGTSTFGLDKTNAQLIVQPGSTGSVTVLATSSSVTGNLDAQLIEGSGQWTVTPASCAVTPGSSCLFTVTFVPPAIGRFPGVLSITTALTQKTVALAGIGGTLAAQRVTMSIGRLRVRRGQTLVIGGTVQNANETAVPVTLQTRPNGYTSWRAVSAATTGQAGTVTFRIRPSQTTTYRLALLASNGNVLTASAPQRIQVTR
jgi:hypothetical protein